MKLNSSGTSHARSLIRQDKIDHESSWEFSAGDGNKILGDPPDWKEYASWHLGKRPDENPETKEAWAYPFGKNGKIYHSAVRAIRTRAAQQGEDEIFRAAGGLLEMLNERMVTKSVEYQRATPRGRLDRVLAVRLGVAPLVESVD